MPFKIKKTVSSLAPSGNSVYFTGASQYLSTPTSTNFDPGTNTAWTLEFWGYPINGCIVTLATGVSWGNSLWLSWGSSQFTWIQGNSAGSNPVNLTTAASYPANNWYHIVVCKDTSNTSRMFINGTQVLSSTYNSSLGSPNRLLVNSAWDNNGFYGGGNGYVSNVRWIKGTALYTASFTVPTSSLTAVTNTQLLTCNAATIIDGSTNNFTITNNGTATVSSAVTPFGSTFLPFKIKKNNPNPTMLTGYGASFNGSNYLSLTGQSLSGTDFTVEAWVYFNTFTTYNSPHVFTFGTDTSNRYNLWRNPTTGKFNLGAINSGTYTLTDGTTTPVTGRWYHVAYVRNGSNNYMYIDGIQDATNAAAINAGTSYAIGFMQYGSQGANNLNGYVSNFRVVKGTALYTASFTPPTTPLTAIASCSLLTCNAATIIDGSTNNFTITNNSGVVPSSSFTPFSSSLIVPTNYSVAFNGSSTWLTTPSTSSLAIGTGDFTYECWAYLSSTPGQYNSNAMSSFVQNSAGDHGTYIGFTSALTAFATLKLDNSTSLTLNSGATTYALNTWHHVVLSRVGTTVSLFFNGSRVATNTNSYNLIENIVAIGKQYATTESGVNGFTNVGVFNGYISNARVVIGGTQPYSPTSTTLTVPTTPISAITNTKLLTCNAATIVDSSSNNLTLTNTGTATVSSTITPFSASVSNSGFKLKHVSYVPPTYMVATGGDLITTSGSYKTHQFTTVGTSSFVVSSLGSNPSVEYLVVGGGGGGGTDMGGGGGAGGVAYAVAQLVSATSYSVVVGAGGLGGSDEPRNSGDGGENGNNSTFNGLIAIGGGGGGGNGKNSVPADIVQAKSGGSGGGTAFGQTAGTGLQSSSLSGGYGNNGATAPNTPAGGGGGAGAAGSAGTYTGPQAGNGGAGGIGISLNINNTIGVGQLSGSNYYIAGGGGGGTGFNGGSAGAGGVGGGGAGAAGSGAVGTAGTANTGGGGGGGSSGGGSYRSGGQGGSGIVLIRYKYI